MIDDDIFFPEEDDVPTDFQDDDSGNEPEDE